MRWVWAIYAAVAVATILWLVPALIHRVRLQGRHWMKEWPDDLEGWHPTVRKAIFDLEGLGFTPVGLQVELFPGSPLIPALVMANPSRHAFGCVTGLVLRNTETEAERPMLFFFSSFNRRKSFVVTFNSPRPEERRSNLRHTGVDSTDLEEVFEEHERQVRDYVAEGMTRDTEYNADTRLRATRAYYRLPPVREVMSGPAQQHLIRRLAVAAGILAIGGISSWYVSQ